jgi:hypothetical protein
MLFSEETNSCKDPDDERKFSGPVLKQFQKSSDDQQRESRAYYRGVSRVTQVEVRQRELIIVGMKTSLWKLKRSLNNLAFRMSFIRLAPGSSRPLLPIAEFLIVGFTIFVLAGGLFVLTQGGQGLLNVASGYSFVYPGDINNQTTQEAVFTTLIYGLGILGLYMMFMSTRYAYRPKRAYGYLAFGMILAVIFIISLYVLIYDKIGQL